jgi:hypothetical protein
MLGLYLVLISVQLLESAIEIELLLGEEGQFREISASFSFGDKDPELALPGFHGVLLDLLDCASDFTGIRRLDFSEKGLRQQGALCLIFNHLHRVASLAARQRLERLKCAKMLKPCRLLSKGLSG